MAIVDVKLTGSVFSPGVAISISAATHKGQDKLARNGRAMVHTLQRHYFRTWTGYEARHTEMQDRGAHHLLFSSNATYGAWLEGVAARNLVTRFSGYHIYRKVTQQLDRDAVRTINPPIKEACDRLNR